MMWRLLLLSSLLLATSSQASTSVFINKDLSTEPLTDVNARLEFTCQHETLPEPAADTDVLFKYARWLQKNNQLKEDKAVDVEVGRLYRIAAENGHYKASINLQNGALRGHFSLSSAERLWLSQQLIDAGVASGHYFIAIYLEHGAAGLKQDEEMALRYYHKAADGGNPQAQAYVANKLAPVDIAPDIAQQMRRCAAEQGEGEAAAALGIHLAGKKRYQDALEVFQSGVAAGNEISAYALEQGFNGPESGDQLNYLGQQKDDERVRRYKAIGKMLGRYSYAHPTVPEINEIVPLPPAPLPTWDGKLKWLEEREANVPPPEPTESQITELANKKQLNPATGQLLPEAPGFDNDSEAPL